MFINKHNTLNSNLKSTKQITTQSNNNAFQFSALPYSCHLFFSNTRHVFSCDVNDCGRQLLKGIARETSQNEGKVCNPPQSKLSTHSSTLLSEKNAKRVSVAACSPQAHKVGVQSNVVRERLAGNCFHRTGMMVKFPGGNLVYRVQIPSKQRP